MKRPLSLKNKLFVYLLFLISTIAHAQIGVVSGVIADNDGVPLPGASIVIKGTSTGTQTDFDGNYRLKCEVGDILVISYIGSQNREVQVTAALFGEYTEATILRKIAVATILDTAYQQAVRKNLPSFLLIPNIEESPKTYNKRNYLDIERIKEISKKDNKVKLSYFNPDVFFEVGGYSLLGMRFIQNKNLPETQKTFAQGLPINGLNTHFGPDTNIPFSYGPTISSLEFDGSDYPYDALGRLIQAGNGNGAAAISYTNSPFQTVFKTSNNLFFNVSTAKHFWGFDYLNKSGKDMYGEERSKLNEFDLSYNNSNNYRAMNWEAQLKHIRSIESQPNINGFQNNLLFNALSTPATFSNNQGSVLINGNQRSFSSSNYNNPKWLLNSNRNQLINDVWLANLRNKYTISDEVYLSSKLSYTQSTNDQQFGLLKNTVGFDDGYRSDKTIAKGLFNADLAVNWNPYLSNFDLDFVSSGNYSNENLQYRFTEQIGFDENSFLNPQDTFNVDRDISRAIFRWYTRLDFRFLYNQAHVTLVNNAFTSTKQNSKWFLPTIQLKYKFGNLLDSDFLRTLDFSASIGYDVNYLNLFYDNQSHNSLQLTPSQSLGYTANNDLFVSDKADLEEKKSFELSLDLGLRIFHEGWNLNTTYFSNTTKGSVFPIWENNQYQLQNSATIKNSGVEWTLDVGVYGYDSIKFIPRIVFSTYQTKVLEILTADDRIPIAGFASISKNLIKGEPAGVLVGTAYARDAQNVIITDNEGFPIVNPELQIIGNPIPEFNLGFSSTLQWQGLQLDFVLDYQKGGDIWNGTQNVLNYLGTSQQSAVERETSDLVFENYQRYGFEGVAEQAMVDGSYFNFKSIDLSYNFSQNANNSFFRQFKISFYGNNLFTTAKFRGASPYSNLFDQTSSQGLHFFNNPIISEVGVKVNIKI